MTALTTVAFMLLPIGVMTFPIMVFFAIDNAFEERYLRAIAAASIVCATIFTAILFKGHLATTDDPQQPEATATTTIAQTLHLQL